LAEHVRITGQTELGFSIAVFPISIPPGGLASITVQASEPRDDGTYVVLDHITREILIEVCSN